MQSAGEKNGGPCRIRTCDLVIKSHLSTGCKGLGDNNLQTGENPVTPTVTPKIEKGAILAALRGLSTDFFGFFSVGYGSTSLPSAA